MAVRFAWWVHVSEPLYKERNVLNAVETDTHQSVGSVQELQVLIV